MIYLGPGIAKVRSCTELDSQKRAEASARKAEAIELHVRSGLSKREFIRECGHKWETGRDYLDPDQPKKCPRPRFMRIARATVERIEQLAIQAREMREGCA